MLHAKIVTVDGCLATVGSANFNARSVSLDDEINLVVIDQALVQQLDEQFDDDLTRSVELDARRWDERPLIQRVVERTIGLVRPVS
jgi:cardiolipin synthase